MLARGRYGQKDAHPVATPAIVDARHAGRVRARRTLQQSERKHRHPNGGTYPITGVQSRKCVEVAGNPTTDDVRHSEWLRGFVRRRSLAAVISPAAAAYDSGSASAASIGCAIFEEARTDGPLFTRRWLARKQGRSGLGLRGLGERSRWVQFSNGQGRLLPLHDRLTKLDRSAAAKLPAEAGSAAVHRNVRASQSVVPPFAVVYRQHFEFVWASARRLGVGVEAIDDVVQEVFVVIHAKLGTLEQPESLRSWIYGIVRRTVSGYHRSRRAKNVSDPSFTVLAELHESAQPNPFDLAQKASEVQLLWSILADIAEPKREVFVLAELEEMTVPEIAQALGIPLNTAYSRLRAARQEFETALARHTARESRRDPG